MRKLFATETSNWLKDLILCNKSQIEGIIIAVFNHSIVLQSDGRFLVHFTNQSDNLSPFSICIEGLKIEKYSVGQNIVLKNNYFFSENILVELDNRVATFDESKIRLKELPSFDEKAMACSDLYKSRFISLRDGIIAEITSKDKDKLALRLSELVGLGDGLTPFGDDYLLGFIYSLYLDDKHEIIEEIRVQILEKLCQLTNLISKEFLFHALNRRFSKNIVENNWDQLLNYGYNSGYFTLLGITDALNVKLRPALN